MNGPEIQRRVNAARVLAEPTQEELAARKEGSKTFRGITVEELADRIGAERLSANVIGDIERGSRTVDEHELRAIARAVRRPYEFFTADFANLRRAGAAELVQVHVASRRERSYLPVVDRARAAAGNAAIVPGPKTMRPAVANSNRTYQPASSGVTLR